MSWGEGGGELSQTDCLWRQRKEGKAPYYCHTTKPLHKAMVSWKSTQKQKMVYFFKKRLLSLVLPQKLRNLPYICMKSWCLFLLPSVCCGRVRGGEEGGGGGDNPVTGGVWECVAVRPPPPLPLPPLSSPIWTLSQSDKEQTQTNGANFFSPVHSAKCLTRFPFLKLGKTFSPARQFCYEKNLVVFFRIWTKTYWRK